MVTSVSVLYEKSRSKEKNGMAQVLLNDSIVKQIINVNAVIKTSGINVNAADPRPSDCECNFHVRNSVMVFYTKSRKIGGQ
jgi:hypothetical protein